MGFDQEPDLRLVLAFQHQLRTSLTTLRGWLSLAEEEAVEIGPATATKLRADVDTLALGLEQMIALLRVLHANNKVLQTSVLERRKIDKGNRDRAAAARSRKLTLVDATPEAIAEAVLASQDVS